VKKQLTLAAALLVLAGAASSAVAAPVVSSNDANFARDVLSSATPVVVDFYADWCGPCRQMGPVVDELSTQYGDRVKFVRVNIDNSPDVAGKFGIRSIPAFRVFQNGRLVGSATGMMPGQNLCKVIDGSIGR
jgi:thioredoxin 1